MSYYKKTHPDTRGGANYSCSDDCDFFYILYDCGNPNRI